MISPPPGALGYQLNLNIRTPLYKCTCGRKYLILAHKCTHIPSFLIRTHVNINMYALPGAHVCNRLRVCCHSNMKQFILSYTNIEINACIPNDINLYPAYKYGQFTPFWRRMPARKYLRLNPLFLYIFKVEQRRPTHTLQPFIAWVYPPPCWKVNIRSSRVCQIT